MSNIRLQLSDGTFTRDWTNELATLEHPILVMREEPIEHPVLPDGTCCEIRLMPPYTQSGVGLMLPVGEKGIDSSDGYAYQFVDFDVYIIQSGQSTPFWNGRRPSIAFLNGDISCSINGGFGLWWPDVTPAIYDLTVDKGWILNNGSEGICDTNRSRYRVIN